MFTVGCHASSTLLRTLLTFLSWSATFPRMLVQVNGEPVEVPAGSTVASLLERVQAEVPRVAVERNRDIVPRATWSQCTLDDGDQIEIVTFVGGG
jgi:thiamine biosynthesis protein ThiS